MKLNPLLFASLFGLALLPATVSAQPVAPSPATTVESWMIGRFIGVNEGMDGHVVALLISPSGHVIAVADGRTVFRGQIDANILTVENNRFTIAQTDEGLSTTQIGNETNVVFYERE